MIRDYKLNPLKLIQKGSVRYREKPLKEDVIELYIDQNKSVKECAEYFGLNIRMFQTMLKEFGIKKDRNQVYQLQKKTLLETKGVENVFQLNDVKEKIKQTNLEKYGASSYTQTDEYKEKNMETRTMRYGDDPFCREKYRETCRKKWGVDNSSTALLNENTRKILESKELLLKYIKDNNILNSIDLAKHLGCCQETAYSHIKKHSLESILDFSKSIVEREIRDYINQYYETENNTRKYLDGKEIDIYIPKLNLGIEFNGNYWHNEYQKDKFYHQNKSLIAESNNIFIYQIFEYEWINNRERIINQLKNLLKINQNKIYARKCSIKEVDNKEKSNFLELNHVQGNDTSSIKLGLYYNNELVSLMTFVKPRFNKTHEYELSRFCSKAGCNVIGGASKLFKYFINNYNPNNIISYSNIAHTRGNLYGNLGFTLQDISEPNYVWINHTNVLSRYQCQKHKLLEQGYIGDSEADIMHNRGYYRIYDCGNKVWIWEKETSQ